MFHDDFIAYRAAEITEKLNDIKVMKQQYLKQLTLIKETLGDCKEILHQKYNLTDIPVKKYFEIKDDLLKNKADGLLVIIHHFLSQSSSNTLIKLNVLP